MGGIRALTGIHHPHQQLASLGVEQLGHAAHLEQIGLLADHFAGDVDGDLGRQQITQLGVGAGQVEVGDGGLDPHDFRAGGGGDLDALLNQLALKLVVVIAANLVLFVGGQQIPLTILLPDKLQRIEQHLIVLAQINARLLVNALIGVALALLEGSQRDRLQAVGYLILDGAATQQGRSHGNHHDLFHICSCILLFVFAVDFAPHGWRTRAGCRQCHREITYSSPSHKGQIRIVQLTSKLSQLRHFCTGSARV